MHKSVYVKRQQVFEQNTREFGKTVGKIDWINIVYQDRKRKQIESFRAKQIRPTQTISIA